MSVARVVNSNEVFLHNPVLPLPSEQMSLEEDLDSPLGCCHRRRIFSFPGVENEPAPGEEGLRQGRALGPGVLVAIPSPVGPPPAQEPFGQTVGLVVCEAQGVEVVQGVYLYGRVASNEASHGSHRDG